MTPIIWILMLLSSVAIPLLGGALGCASRIGQLSAGTTSWIVTWSLPFIVLSVVLAVVLGLLHENKIIPFKAFCGWISATNIVCFFGALWILDGVSGVG